MPKITHITHNGITQPLRAWAQQYGMRGTTLWQRLKKGMSIDDALTSPLKYQRTGTINSAGYVMITKDGVMKTEHVRIAEKLIGKPLPKGAEVHHVDENPSNNKPSNLVICPSHAYHALLHVRQRASDATGNPNMRKCTYCKEYSLPTEMVSRGSAFKHIECERKAVRDSREKARKERST